MNKPEMKREVGVKYISDMDNAIHLTATDSALQDIAEFGDVLQFPNSSVFRLSVDPRYDFNEVVDYIQNYSSQVELDEDVWG